MKSLPSATPPAPGWRADTPAPCLSQGSVFRVMGGDPESGQGQGRPDCDPRHLRGSWTCPRPTLRGFQPGGETSRHPRVCRGHRADLCMTSRHRGESPGSGQDPLNNDCEKLFAFCTGFSRHQDRAGSGARGGGPQGGIPDSSYSFLKGEARAARLAGERMSRRPGSSPRPRFLQRGPRTPGYAPSGISLKVQLRFPSRI